MSDYDRHRDPDLYGRRRDFDDDRRDTAGRSGEGRSWRGRGDHDFEPQQVGARGYGYNASQHDDRFSRPYGEERYGGRDFERGADRGSDRSGYRTETRRDSDRRDHRSGSGEWDRDTHGYAPGSQIWGQSDRGARQDQNHDFEPDYLHWREQQMASFDNDYRSWRDERRTRFTNDFDTWRKSRSDNVKAEAANPYVGDVSEGGVGRVTTAKPGDRDKQ